MLACSQDLYFHNDINANYQNVIHDPAMLTMQPGTTSDNDSRLQLQQRKDSMMSTTSIDDMSSLAIANHNLKDKEEQVWPPDVEAAFVEALESIPKLGRRKILVNGKPCGRNELISDFIYRKTLKVRTRKQVSSHIQVLKNTRKGDAHFMRLLTDSVESDDKTNANGKSNNTNTNSNSKMKGKQAQPYSLNHHAAKNSASGSVKMKTHQSIESLSSDDSSINSSPSPNDYMLDIMCADPSQQQLLNMLQLKDFYDPMQHLMVDPINGTSSLSLLENNLITDPFFGFGSMDDVDMLNPSLINQEATINTSMLTSNNPENLTEEELLMSSLNMLKRKSRKMNKKMKQAIENSTIPPQFSLWPNYLCLYLEYTLAYDPCRPISHNLSQLLNCHANNLPKVDISALPKEKCPPLASYGQNSKTFPLLLAKTQLDLNLAISEFAFNNTFFFEAQVRRTIECTTTIYSFGNVVLESKEVQQALWVSEGKYMYNFVFVNQFFDAFMKGIRSLQSWDEVDIAVNNLCIVQSFEDIETKHAAYTKSPLSENQASQDTASPLLVMFYEFERGNGTIDISLVDDNSKAAVDMESTFDFLESNI